MESESALTVRFATDVNSEWCVRTATLDSPGFVRRTPGGNEMVVAQLSGSLVCMLQLNCVWPGHVGFVECDFFAGAPFEARIGEVFFAKALT